MRLFKKKQKHGWFKSKLSWEDTKKQCVGYDDRKIAIKSFNNSKKSSSGELLPYAIISELQFIARNKSELNILDFGGGFGNLFNQVSRYLPDIKINWNIVEQESYVELGSANVPDVNFYSSIDQVKDKVDVVIASGVLQYLQDPRDVINQLLNLNPEHIIIDRLPVFLKKQREDTITIQKVPEEIYGFDASYPCWIFNEEDILKDFTKNYKMNARFYSHQDCRNNVVVDKSGVDFMGYYFKR